MKATREIQERLLALQQLDSDLIQIKHKASTLPIAKKFDEVSKELQAKRDLLVAANTERLDIKHELSRAEVDVEQVVSRIERDEKRLSSGQGTPKELEQLQHELGSLAKRRAELEEVELEIMVRVEGIDLRIKELESECAALETQVNDLRVKKDEELSSLESSAKSSTDSRTNLAPTIDAELLALYEKMRASGDGVGAAKLAGNQCLGCHLTMNSAELTRIKALPDDEVVRCEECRRILIRLN
ncbi:MAG: zinc ribbon domain-containing protein [Actinomycetota bacterium]